MGGSSAGGPELNWWWDPEAAAIVLRAPWKQVVVSPFEAGAQIWSSEQLQEWRWNPLIYTDLAGNSIYLLMARDFAPLPARLHSVGSRLSELPRLLLQVRESLDPARVPRIHAETAVKQNSGVLNLIDELVVPQLP